MLTTEELELIMRVQGAADVDRLKESLAAQDKTLRELNDAYAKGIITHQTYETQARRTIAGIVQGNAELKEAQRAAGQMTTEMSGANTAIRNLGFGISDVFSNNGPLGQKIQGFANNVGQMVTGVLQQFGKLGPGGIAAAAGLEIAFTATGAALTAMGIKSVDDLVRAFTGGTKNAQDRLSELQERIKELEHKKVKVSADVVELEHARDEAEKLKKNLEAIEELRTGQTAAERESGKRIKEDLTEGGGQDALNEMVRQERESQLRASQVRQQATRDRDEAQETITELSARGRRSGPGDANRQASAEKALADANERLKMIQLAAQQAAEGKVGEDIRQATEGTGPGMAAGQRSLRQRLTNAGEGNTAERMAMSTPAEVKEGEEFKQQMKDRDQETKRANEAQRAAEKAQREADQQAAKEKREKTAQDALLKKAMKFRQDEDLQAETNERTDAMEQLIVDTFGSTDKFMSYKADQAAAKKTQRTADQAAKHQQNAMAQNITRETGGDVRGDAAQAAAQQAIQYVNRGATVQQAMQQSVFDLMHGVINNEAAMLALYERQAANVGRLGNMHAQNSARLRTNLSKTGN